MTRRIVAVGEAMVEFAPVEGDLYRRGFAGDTFNTLWHMAQLLGGFAQCGFVTRIGCDRISDDFVAEVAADGVDTSAVKRDPDHHMGLYVIELDGSERSFQYWRGQSAARKLADDRDALARSIVGADLAHLSSITLAILPAEERATLFDVLAQARAGGTQIAFDPNFRPKLWPSLEEARDAIVQMLANTDIVLPSFDDEQTLWGDAAPQATIARFVAQGLGEIVVKNGANSVHIHSHGTTRVIETVPATSVRDTSGAGDAFNAGYLAARMTGKPPLASVAVGQALASEALSHHGARIPRETARSFALHPTST